MSMGAWGWVCSYCNKAYPPWITKGDCDCRKNTYTYINTLSYYREII